MDPDYKFTKPTMHSSQTERVKGTFADNFSSELTPAPVPKTP